MLKCICRITFIRDDTSLVFKVFQLSILWWVWTTILVLGPSFLPSLSRQHPTIINFKLSNVKIHIQLYTFDGGHEGLLPTCGDARVLLHNFGVHHQLLLLRYRPQLLALDTLLVFAFSEYLIDLTQYLLRKCRLTSHEKLPWTVFGRNWKWKPEYQDFPWCSISSILQLTGDCVTHARERRLWMRLKYWHSIILSTYRY